MKGANTQIKMILIIFRKKNWGKWTILGPKMVHPYNTRSAVRIFYKILPDEKGQQVGESNNNGLFQKNLFNTNWGILGPKMAHLHNSGLGRRIFLKILQNERGQQVDENNINIFFQKIFLGGQMNHFGPKMTLS